MIRDADADAGAGVGVGLSANTLEVASRLNMVAHGRIGDQNHILTPRIRYQLIVAIHIFRGLALENA